MVLAEMGSQERGVIYVSTTEARTRNVIEPWRNSIGNLFAIADAHNEHMIIFVDQFEKVYLFTDPDGKLYSLGSSLADACETLLLGKDVGPPIPRDDE